MEYAIIWFAIGFVSVIYGLKLEGDPICKNIEWVLIGAIFGVATFLVVCGFLYENKQKYGVSWCNQSYASIKKAKKKLEKRRKKYTQKAYNKVINVPFNIEFTTGEVYNSTQFVKPYVNCHSSDPKLWKTQISTDEETRKYIIAKIMKEGIILENNTYYPPDSVTSIKF